MKRLPIICALAVSWHFQCDSQSIKPNNSLEEVQNSWTKGRKKSSSGKVRKKNISPKKTEMKTITLAKGRKG